MTNFDQERIRQIILKNPLTEPLVALPLEPLLNSRFVGLDSESSALVNTLICDAVEYYFHELGDHAGEGHEGIELLARALSSARNGADHRTVYREASNAIHSLPSDCDNVARVLRYWYEGDNLLNTTLGRFQAAADWPRISPAEALKLLKAFQEARGGNRPFLTGRPTQIGDRLLVEGREYELVIELGEVKLVKVVYPMPEAGQQWMNDGVKYLIVEGAANAVNLSTGHLHPLTDGALPGTERGVSWLRA